ncbi:hypothetical protein LINGRAHAP2_LOCUS20496, partial [Linum grandiflorum]
REKSSPEGSAIWDLPRRPLSCLVRVVQTIVVRPVQFKSRTRCFKNLRRLCSKRWRDKPVLSARSSRRWVKYCKVLWRVHPIFHMTRPDPGHLTLAKENAQHQVVR